MKSKFKSCFLILLVSILVFVITIIGFKWYYKNGSCSQKALVEKHEKENLLAIEKANLPKVEELPFLPPYDPVEWVDIPYFHSPTPLLETPIALVLAFSGTQNGPLEGSPFKVRKGIIYKDITLVLTHGWVNQKRWGLAYSPNNELLPLPYWSKHLTGHWYVWYTGGDVPATKQGVWYE